MPYKYIFIISIVNARIFTILFIPVLLDENPSQTNKLILYWFDDFHFTETCSKFDNCHSTIVTTIEKELHFKLRGWIIKKSSTY